MYAQMRQDLSMLHLSIIFIYIQWTKMNFTPCHRVCNYDTIKSFGNNTKFWLECLTVLWLCFYFGRQDHFLILFIYMPIKTYLSISIKCHTLKSAIYMYCYKGSAIIIQGLQLHTTKVRLVTFIIFENLLAGCIFKIY